jgi:hypothetical protein
MIKEMWLKAKESEWLMRRLMPTMMWMAGNLKILIRGTLPVI